MILSILMLFLYKSYAALNKSNTLLAVETQKLIKTEKIKKSIYLDYTNAIAHSVKILKQNAKEDIVFMQTTNSLHKRINPYVAYIMKEHNLYRLESLKPFKEYPLGADSEFVTDILGTVKSFRTYKSQDAKKELYLVHILFEDKSEILLKMKVLNSF